MIRNRIAGWFLLILVISTGCTTVKSVPPLSEEESDALRACFTSHGEFADAGLVIAIDKPDYKTSSNYHARKLKTIFEMVPFVKEINYTQELKGTPTYIISDIREYRKAPYLELISMPFCVLTLGVIPHYRDLCWGSDFNIKSVKSGHQSELKLHDSSFGFSGWIAIIINILPGWQYYCICGEYEPFEMNCRLLLQLVDQIDKIEPKAKKKDKGKDKDG